MLTRNWYWILAALVVIGLGSFQILRPKKPLKKIKIYKTVTPAPKPNQPEAKMGKTDDSVISGSDHAHDRGTASHSHSVELVTRSNGEKYNWWDDSLFDSPKPNVDPWKQTYPEDEPTNDIDDTYPPRNWHETEDPALYTEYYRAQLIKQFGDIPQAYTIAELEGKMRAEIPMTLEEHIEFNQALYDLWQNQGTMRALEMLRDWEASGVDFVHVYNEPIEEVDQFLDAQPFVEQHGFAEGIRRFRAANPERASEFEHVLREDVRKLNPERADELERILKESRR